MAIQDRYSALQNETVRLAHIFEYDGNLLALPEVPSVDIVDQDGVVTLETLTAEEQTPGIYFVDYNVPLTLPTGQYYDRWRFKFSSSDDYTEVITHFEVHPHDAIMNFSSSVVSQKFTDIMERGIRNLSNDFIYGAMHIPVYGEQAQRTPSGKRYNFAFPNWNRDPRPLVRVNQRLVDEGWYCDYMGNVYFEKALDDSDVVTAYYNFAFFGKEDLASFLDAGLDAMNAIPPASASYNSLSTAPREWWHGIQLYAAMQALRRLLLGMSFQETSIIFGEGDRLSMARENINSLYESYSSSWTEFAAGIKKKLPGTGAIVLPEYTLPGGRARWYRYLYVSGVN